MPYLTFLFVLAGLIWCLGLPVWRTHRIPVRRLVIGGVVLILILCSSGRYLIWRFCQSWNTLAKRRAFAD
jgi:hypothetical protein